MKVALFLMVVCVGCGGRIDDKGASKGSGQTGTTTNTTNTTTATNNTIVTTESCGDGVLDAGELCDPGKASGAGACPQSCEAPACATATLVGSASSCTAQCIVEPVACANADGCCPAGCDSSTDSDCGNACGDGVVEGPESCDGNCPTQCGDNDACTTDTLVGSAAQCSAQCVFETVTTCTSGDGCCPAGCDGNRDSDCAPVVTCGNGTIDAGETCDGNCPSSCNDNIACTTDRLTGSAAMCTAQCAFTQISACTNGDGCCPAGCTFQNDNDCACVPKTCAQLGAECGTVSNGCGATITCTDTCTSIEVCSAQNRCVQEDFIGASCTDYPECGSSNDAVCILPPTWPNGYCSILCNSQTGNTLCPTGSHCADFDGANSLCMSNCTSNTQCDSGYVCRQWDGVGGLECVPPQGTVGSGDVGDACNTDGDCGTNLSCVKSYVDTNNMTTNFPGGTCTESCLPVFGTCSSGVCGLESLCMPTCNSNADCRAGYTCSGLGLPLGNYCWPS